MTQPKNLKKLIPVFLPMSNKIRIAVAGSTERTALCAASLFADERFEILWILTPEPKVIGRKKILTQNPLHHWADDHAITTIQLQKKIDAQVKDAVLSSAQVDFLLVVDFGYLVPKWLLELPSHAPLNIHPSLLPRWRGSSPGQFVLLYGEKDSAVTLMVMDEDLDSGPLIAQLPFSVGENWTQREYYQYSFDRISEQLAGLIYDFAEGKLPATPQPSNSPTAIARRLTREDGFVEWSLLDDLRSYGIFAPKPHQLNSLLSPAKHTHPNVISLLAHAARALSPWPGLWTEVNTSRGKTRMKILSCHEEKQRLIIDQIQLEGKLPASWNEAKSAIIDLIE